MICILYFFLHFHIVFFFLRCHSYMLSCFSYTVSTSVCSVDSLSLASHGKPITLQFAPKRPRSQDARFCHVKLRK